MLTDYIFSNGYKFYIVKDNFSTGVISKVSDDFDNFDACVEVLRQYLLSDVSNNSSYTLVCSRYAH